MSAPLAPARDVDADVIARWAPTVRREFRAATGADVLACVAKAERWVAESPPGRPTTLALEVLLAARCARPIYAGLR